MSESDSHDVDGIVSSANGFRTANDVKGLAKGYHAATAEYFGEDVTGRVSGLTVNTLAAAIALSRGEDSAKAFEYAGKADSKDELVDELETAWTEIGLIGDESAPIAEISPYSVGPILPYLNGILSSTYGVDVSAAVKDFYGDD